MTWYSASWKRRMPITIDTSLKASGNVTFALTIPPDWDDFWDNVRSDGYDVVILDETGNGAISFERVTWTPSTKTGVFKAYFGAVKGANVIHQAWLYWNNPDQSSDLATTGLPVSSENAYIYLGAPFKYIVSVAGRSSLSTVPTTVIQKDPDEDIDVWFPVSQLLSPRALASSEKLDFKLINYYDFEVLDSSSVSQSMILLNDTRAINGWVKCRLIDGTTNTDYVLRAIIKNTDLETFILSCLIQVRKLLPS